MGRLTVRYTLVLLFLQDFKNGRVQDGGGGSVKQHKLLHMEDSMQNKEGLWNIVNETKMEPIEGAERQAQSSRQDKIKLL